MAEEYRRAARLLCIFALASGLNRVVDLAFFWSPSPWPALMLDLASALASLLVAILLWPRLKGLIALPSSQDLMAANQRLADEEQARSKLVTRLWRVNDELERRVGDRTAELAEAKQRFEAALIGSNITMAQQDRDLRYIWVHNPPEPFSPEAIIGQLPGQILPEATEQILKVAKLRVMATRQPERIEVFTHTDQGERWFDERIEPVIRDGDVIGVICVAIDITSHKRSEQILYSLLRELTHRSRNLLAVVQGLARQTAESTDTMTEFNSRFAARLQALSGAHELLVRRSWQGVDLHDLIRQEIDASLVVIAERVTVRGQREILGPEAAQNIALGLHELMTNAIVYGALTSPVGHVDISWKRVRIEGSDLLELQWAETSDRATTEPLGRGISRALVERLVPRAIEGTSELLQAQNGLSWTLRFPVTRLVSGA
jgi:two-component sensor histidine kinase